MKVLVVATGVVGDLLDPSTLGVFKGFDAVFLLNPVSTTEVFEGLLGVNAARDGGAKRIVYLTVHHLDRAAHLPHFGGKIAIEAIIQSGMEHTIRRPNNRRGVEQGFGQAGEVRGRRSRVMKSAADGVSPGDDNVRFKQMYAYLQKEGVKTTPADIDTQTKVLGHAPRSFEAYANKMAAGWK